MHHNSTSHVDGTALPNSIIELFYDDDCPDCEGKTYFATVSADANGYWQYDGALNGRVIATATSVGGSTSDFSSALMDSANLKIIQPGCGQKTGEISGLSVLSGASFHWEDENGNIVGRDTVLKNIGPGKYRFVVSTGMNENIGCQAASDFIVVDESTPKIISDNVTVKDASCGQKNGAITGIQIGGKDLKTEWENEAKEVVSNATDLGQVGPGKYTLYLEDTLNHCQSESNPFVINNLKGPSLDVSKAIITDASCSKANGSIRQIQVKGPGDLLLTWVNQDQTEFGDKAELNKVPGGKYVLKVTDGSGCPSVESDSFTIADKGTIQINSDKIHVEPSNCNSSTGSITGIEAENADAYYWVNDEKDTVDRTTSLTSASPGNYHLYTSNTVGCTAETGEIAVPQTTPPAMKIENMTTIPPTCNTKNGSIRDILITGGTPVAYAWKDADGNLVGNQKTIENIGPGQYALYVIGEKGCEQLVTSVILSQPPLPVIDDDQLSVTDDRCESGEGSIKGLSVKGEAPFSYNWINSNGQTSGTNHDLESVTAGTYQLIATDNSGCKISSPYYQITNNDIPLDAPDYPDITIVQGMDATLTPDNPGPGVYTLYSSVTDPDPLYSSATGIFSFHGLKESTELFAERQYGNCVSSRSAVKIQVLDNIKIFVPTAFSPNGDGQNDYLRVFAYGVSSINYFNIYNRWGKLIFHTQNVSAGWDGKSREIAQPLGAYVWELSAKGVNGEIIKRHGTVTLLR
jgi:gliding motility-associated-like protein